MNTDGRILIVDDHKTNLKKIGMVIKSLGHDAVTADSGSEALRLVNTEEFDVILLDIIMPEMDGFEVLSQLKQNED